VTQAGNVSRLHLGERDAFIVVDPQNDFCPGGSLPVPRGDEVFGPINRALPKFRHVLATQDWHPPEHRYFQAHGGPWPHHCVQGTRGAEFHSDLDVSRIQEVIQKGMEHEQDGYSGFAGTDLVDRLRARGVERVFIAGLATDYCVKATAVEAVEHGFETYVLMDAIRPVEVEPGDGERALRAMAQAGVHLITSDMLG
jgi:nicotinamidase/pyrazinamidase